MGIHPPSWLNHPSPLPIGSSSYTSSWLYPSPDSPFLWIQPPRRFGLLGSDECLSYTNCPIGEQGFWRFITGVTNRICKYPQCFNIHSSRSTFWHFHTKAIRTCMYLHGLTTRPGLAPRTFQCFFSLQTSIFLFFYCPLTRKGTGWEQTGMTMFNIQIG